MHVGTSIAIDGPVASGKTVVGRLIARDLGYPFLDTGVMYRAIAWVILNRSVKLEDSHSVEELIQSLSLEVRDSPSGNIASINGHDITQYLRTPEVESFVSRISEVPFIRELMVHKQRAMTANTPMVLAGRDIGTVVIPQARLKFFLKASSEERANRRYIQMVESGKSPELSTVKHELDTRDQIDTKRIHSPLKIATDAHVIDTDSLSIKQVVQRILDIVRKL
jgi:cytidylate kinase